MTGRTSVSIGKIVINTRLSGSGSGRVNVIESESMGVSMRVIGSINDP